MYVYVYVCLCPTGVVYDNISTVFMLWELSINNKAGLVLFANVYLRYQSVLNLELNLWYQNNNTLLITKYII